MAIDQNLILNDLRPLNLARNAVEENRVPPTIGFIPNSVVRDVDSPRSRQVYYPVTILDSGGNPTTSWYPYQQPMPVSSGGNGVVGDASDHGGDESVNDSGSVKKVKLMCSFGGKILPRPNDGLLRYVGGQTRIISVRRDISFQELVHKMIDAYGRPVVIKYQLPNEDLDALVSVSGLEDLENMMEEYGKLVEEGSGKLRVFLFSASELDASGLVQFSDVLDSGQKYIDAINGVDGVGEGITRKGSVASATSTYSDSQLSWGQAPPVQTVTAPDGWVTHQPGIIPEHFRQLEDCHMCQKALPHAHSDTLPQDHGDSTVVSGATWERTAEQQEGWNQPMAGGYTDHDVNTNQFRVVGVTQDREVQHGKERLLVQFSDELDSGQKYIDAINGVDGVGEGITRKGSVASATSTHSDSQLSWGEAVESSAPSQGDGGGIMSPSMSSPRVAIAASHDAPTSLAYVPPNPVTYAEPIPVPMSHPTMLTVNPQNLASLRPEARTERAIPAILPQQQQQLGYNLQQPSGMDFRPPATYMQAYVDPRQHLPPQVGYANPQLVGVPRSIYTVINTQQQLQDNTAGIPPQQFVPAVHMTMAPAALHTSMNSNGTQHFVQPHQSQVNHYPGESFYGARVVQLPVEQSHGTYQPQATGPLQKEGFPLQTGGYGWCQAPPVQTVTAPDGWVTHQPGIIPEHFRQLEDCHMCQKALPHAHSDTLPQDHGDSTVVSGAMWERTAEQQEGWNQPMAGGYTDHDVNTNQFRVVGVTQDREVQHGKERLLQIPDNLNQQGFPPQGVVGNPVDVKISYGVFLGNVPQSHQEDALQQPSMLPPYQVKQEVVMHQPVGTNFLPVNIIPPFQTSESMVQDSSTQHIDKHPGLVPNNDISDSRILYNHVRPIDGRTEIHVSPSEISRSNEQCTAPAKRLIKEDIPVGRPQITGQDMFPSNAFTMSGVYPVGNDTKPNETQPPSSSETSYYHYFQPVESKEITQADLLGSSGPYPNIGVQQTTSDHIWHDTPPFTGVDSVVATDRYNPIGEWQDEASQFQSRMLPNDTMADPSSGISSSPSDGMVQDNWGAAPSNSLFSNQDPWTLHHDSCVPKTSNLPGREVVNTMEEGVPQKPEGDLNKDSNAEHFRSEKEEYIRKELKAVAEGVAALVLQSSITSDSVHGMTELIPEAGVEDVKTKIPISDGIGRLQIIKNIDLEELRELGSGTFGTVYHGKWRGSDVAIKRINDRCFTGKPSEKDRMLDDFWNEAIKLADLHHPNVVAFYGVVLDGPGGSVATVTEYMVNGSLRQALQRNDRTLDKRKRLLIGMDVAFGMEYLHEKNIVHFDLKSDNLLVNLRDPHRPICKVGDLGLSKVKCQTLISGGVRGTLPWMAPELLNGSSSLVSEKVDVFSFGIVMWELLTGEEPYADLHYGAIIGGIVNNTLRPSVPVSCDSEWRSLMESCWSAEPSERPSFTQIASILRSMAASLPQKGQNQQQPQDAKMISGKMLPYPGVSLYSVAYDP